MRLGVGPSLPNHTVVRLPLPKKDRIQCPTFEGDANSV